MTGHTEAEALVAWCPFARHLNLQERDEAGAFNRTMNKDGSEGFTLCIASKCMAWRWGAKSVNASGNTNGIPQKGFCGLAGKP